MKYRTKVLDHGYVQFVESWGSDRCIIEAARMSTDKGFLGWEPGPCPSCAGGVVVRETVCITCNGKGTHDGDEKLLAYLWKNKHSTPFEFAGLTLEVQAPIMVFREWHRHRTETYAERSARYTPLANVNYLPTPERCLMGVATAGTNRQATGVLGAEVLSLDSALEWLSELEAAYEACEQVYQSGLRRGIPKELARLIVPVGRYSTMRVTTDLRNWLGFCSLRLPKNAQYEIRVFAQVVHDTLAEVFPRTLELFDQVMSEAR